MIHATVIGATGYSGQELTRLLHAHPNVHIGGLFGSSTRQDSAELATIDPRMSQLTDLHVRALDLDALRQSEPDVVFLATPHKASAALAPALLEAGATVIDLSGAYRLTDAASCAQWYDIVHEDVSIAASAVYGLPERNRDAIARADLISCPGCYPTSVLIPLIGLRAAGLVDGSAPVIVDSASGVTGAGRTPSDRVHFCEVSFEAYGVGGHRHEPEMCAHGGMDIHFTPHLGPWKRGILTTMHASIQPDADIDRGMQALRSWAGDEPAVRFLDESHGWPRIASVEGTNLCDFRVHVDEPRAHLTVVSAIDNLVKGASGQAIQCMNLRYGFDESLGLIMKDSESVPC